MPIDPIDNSNQNIIPTKTELERKLKNNNKIFKALTVLITLASLGMVATIICVSLVLIPWVIAITPMVIAFTIIIICLIGLKITQGKNSRLKSLTKEELPFPKDEILEIPDPQEAPSLSLNDFASMLKDEYLRTLLFPPQDTSSIDPVVWFSEEKLRTAFLNNWLPFCLTISGNDCYRFWGNFFPRYITLRSGNTSIFQKDVLLENIGAIVNATNHKISLEQGQTNSIITTMVTQESWEQSKEGKTKLKVSEVSAGPWISQTPVEEGCLSPSFLIHVLSPKADSYPNTFEAYSVLISSYLNCFEKAHSLEVHTLQIPLLSSFPYDGVLDRGWPSMTKFAFLTAITLFFEQNPESCLRDIILVGLDKPPTLSSLD